jgi:hypothetical protein
VKDCCDSGSVWSGLVLEDDDDDDAAEGEAEAAADAAAALMMSAACDVTPLASSSRCTFGSFSR